ncbi:MAG: hypothetical protein HKP19_11350, partial [Xanthomonadales bacterium]|nr:hypothetical protein [Xanthomonadales bacterium]
MKKFFSVLFLGLSFAGIATGAETVPPEVQMPGTQPLEIGNLESPNKCDNCHGGYNAGVEPAHNWRGSMMAQAGRDPIFWATLAIAEQDFDGAGDLCLRCHSTGGWLAGRSTPTDGSGLASGDSDGVECDYCHKLTDPADGPFDPQGEMNAPFVANDGAQGWYGSGMSSMWGGSDKLGPYDNADARHQFMYSRFHRSPEFCGTCHDVSNPVVGDLAHNNGAMNPDALIVSNGTPGTPVEGKAAFNNPPHAYGVVERTFSEHMSSPLSGIEVDNFEQSDLPEGGAFQAIHEAATAATGSADYSNPTEPRYYTCQTCHMRPLTGTGANKRGVPVRHDLPLHDMTGGNYWMAEAIIWLDERGLLRLGGGLSADQKDAMRDAAIRAREQLQLAATLEVEDPEDGVTLGVEIINHTGHKLITGYPEGRRMWLNVRWFDAAENELEDAEIGRYGDLVVTIDGGPQTVKTLLNPEADHDSGYVFEAHMGITQEWAAQLISVGVAPPGLALSYDRVNGNTAGRSLGDLANQAAGTKWPTFHFAINNTVYSDNRIPPFEMSATVAYERNATPVPNNLYLDTVTGLYLNEREFNLDIPEGAVRADISLLYQPTSWEYIQFLYLANDGSSAFLGNEGRNILDAWLATGMA